MFLFVLLLDVKLRVDILIEVEGVQVTEDPSLDVVYGPFLPYILCDVDCKLL